MPLPDLLSKYGIQAEKKKTGGVPNLISTKYNDFKEPALPVTPPAKPGFFADQNIGGIIKNTILGLPKAAWNTLGPGKILDYLKTPEGQDAASRLTASDVGTGVVQSVGGVIAQPVADIAGVFTGPKTFKVPVIGDVTNIQKQTQERIEGGMHPAEAFVNAVPQAIFDALTVAGVGQKAFGSRPSPITPKGTVETKGAFPAETPMKTGRLYQPETYKQGVPNATFEKITTEHNIPVKPDYNPKNPIFFEASKVGPTGESVGQFFQIKPSYFKVFTDILKGDPAQVPPTAKLPVASIKPAVIEAPKPPTVETPSVPIAPPSIKEPISQPSGTISPVSTPLSPVKAGDVVSFHTYKNGKMVGVEPEGYTVKEVINIGTESKPNVKILVDINGKDVWTTPEGVTQKEQVAGAITGKPEPLTIKPAVPTKVAEVIKGENVIRPEQLVTKTQVKEMLRGLGRDSVDFTVQEIDGKKYMTYKEGQTEMKLRPKALGLIEDNIKVGQTVRINANDLKAPGTALRGINAEGDVEASLKANLAKSEENPAKTPEELAKRIEQLNKFGQAHAILRKTGGVPKKASGHFVPKSAAMGPKGPRGKVELRQETAKNPEHYMSTLAHELGHALENTLVGKTNVDTFAVFGKNLTTEQKATLRTELKLVTDDLVGKAEAASRPAYYYKNTELFARFLQSMFVKPGSIAELAPTAMEMFEASAAENPIISDYLEAVMGTIDKGQLNDKMIGRTLEAFLGRDMRQSFIKKLGTRNGEEAWNRVVRYRAMKERAKIQIEKLVESSFKGVKDDPELLFNAVESIKVTKEGVPEFGTRDFLSGKNPKDIAKLEEAGYRALKNEEGQQIYDLVKGEQLPRYYKERYSPEQGKAFYEQLSPEGKTLVNEFTASRDEAKTYFNREVIKDIHKINSNIEGWVHHYWADKALGTGGNRLKMKTASAKRQRMNIEGYEKDLKKAMIKSLTELETDKAYNEFMKDFFPRVTRPIAEGEKPLEGWVEVHGDIMKGGVDLPYRNKMVIMKDGKAFPAKQARYQMPKEVYARFEALRGLADEATTGLRIINSLNRYWRVNILMHMGSNATNFISGGIQYSAKIFTDFYKEVLTGDIKMPQTRSNIFSMFTVLSPKGWQNAPDWIYGNDLSNNYGQYLTETGHPGLKVLDKSIDAYADKGLKLYGLVERYWKKVIMTADNVSSLKNLNVITKEGLKLPTEEENAMIDLINREVDLFGLDYDNVSVALQQYKRGTLGQSLKPFAVFPYKMTKAITQMIEDAFDGTKSPKDRLASIMALGTMVAVFAYLIESRRKEQQTVSGGETTPSTVSPAGKIYIGTDKEGREKFTRISKYPFVNFVEAGMQLADGQTAEAWQVIRDMVGGVGPGGQILAAVLGYKQDFQQYMPPQVIAGQALSAFVPASRILNDIASYQDPYQRKATTFLQGFTSFYPTTDPELQEKLRGKIRTISVPLEAGVLPAGDLPEKSGRTTTEMFLRNYKEDILMQALMGIYVKRIDPQVAEAFKIREEKNALERDKKGQIDPFYLTK